MAVFFVCAGLLGVLAALLTLNVGRMRGRKKIFLGDGGDPEMIKAIRAHGNLIELTPLILLLIWMLHGPGHHLVADILAVALVVARVLHAGGMLGFLPYGRLIGAVGTTVILAWVSVTLVAVGLKGL